MTRMQFAIPVPEEMSVSHMALSQDGSMLAFVSPEENSALPMLYVQRIGSSSVTLLPGTQGASYPFWSPDDAVRRIFRQWQVAEDGGNRRHAAGARERLGGRGGSWGSKNVIIYSPDAQSPLQRINADGTGRRRSHWDQDCRGSIAPLAALSSRRRPFLILGRQLWKSSKTTARAASTSVLSRARKENLLCSAIRVLTTMRTTCFMPTTNDSWSRLRLTLPPARFQGVRPWSRMPSDFNPPLIGQHSLRRRMGH